MPVDNIILRARSKPFDLERYAAWLADQPGVALDPVERKDYMVLGTPEGAEWGVNRRLADPTEFPLTGVLITIDPEEAPKAILVSQEFGNKLTLRIACDFIKMVVEETDCEIFGDSGDWTERVRREGVDAIYQNLRQDSVSYITE